MRFSKKYNNPNPFTPNLPSSSDEDFDKYEEKDKFDGCWPSSPQPEEPSVPVQKTSVPSSRDSVLEEIAERMNDEAKARFYRTVHRLNLTADDSILIYFGEMGYWNTIFESIPEKIKEAIELAVENGQIPIVKTKNEAVKEIKVMTDDLYEDLKTMIDAATAKIVNDAKDQLETTTEDVAELYQNAVHDLEALYHDATLKLEKQQTKAKNEIIEKMAIDPFAKAIEYGVVLAMIAGSFVSGVVITKAYPEIFQMFGL